MAKAVRKSTPAVKKPAAVTFLDPELAPDLYALLVKGDCMAPLHTAGSAVLIDKREPYQGGDVVVIYMKPEAVKPGHLNVMLKRLVSMPPWVKGFPYRENPKSEVHALATVEMLNPAQRIHFRCSDILAIHRCLGAVPADVRLISPLASAAHASDVTERRDLTRRSIVRSVLVGSAASLSAISVASAFETDPIFAAIERHRAASKAWLAVVYESDDESPDPDRERRYDETFEAQTKAACALCDTAPSSMAGTVALLRYVTEQIDRDPEIFPVGLVPDGVDPETAGFGDGRDTSYFIMKSVAGFLQAQL